MVGAFDMAKEELQRAKTALADLPNERSRRMAKLRAGLRDYQRHRYLDRFRIDRAKIPGIGRGRATTLASFGIETADDVTAYALNSVPGFGPKLTRELLSWRQRHEAQFQFNPSEPVAPQEIARVEAEIAALQQNLIQQLQRGVGHLQRLAQEIPAARQRLMPMLSKAWDDLKVAELQRAAL